MNDRAVLLVALLALGAVLAYTAMRVKAEGYGARGVDRVPGSDVTARHVARASKAMGLPVSRRDILILMGALAMSAEQVVSLLEMPLSIKGTSIPPPPDALRDLVLCTLTRTDCGRAMEGMRNFYNAGGSSSPDYDLLIWHLLWLRQNVDAAGPERWAELLRR